MIKRLFLLLATLCFSLAFAQQKEQRVALVIGNGAYKASPLKNPVNDATDMAQALRDKGFLVILKTNASRRQMVESVRDFGNQIKRGGVGFFYYAGHGIQSKGRNYLVPVGVDVQSEADLEFETVDASMVLAQMDDAGNRVNIMVLDACRDNPFARSFRTASRGLTQLDGAKGSFLAFATSPGSVASDGDGRNGIYTKHLLTSLRQSDTKLENVFKRVRVEVAKETGNKQIPWDSSSVLGEFYFNQTQIASTETAPLVSTPPAQNRPVQAGASYKDCEDCPDMVVIPAGTFMMGSKADPFASLQPFKYEQPQHSVSVRSFSIGKYEVTQEQWYAVIGTTPSRFKGRTLPVEQVSWDDAQEFVQKLSIKTGKKYRLPSEAEWEYSARAGSQTVFSFGDDENQLSRYAWFSGNSELQTHQVGEKPPNSFGLHDMHGNVWEWTQDCWNQDYDGAPNDASAWVSGYCKSRVLRGGSWYDSPADLRSANRGGITTIRYSLSGFRVARDN